MDSTGMYSKGNRDEHQRNIDMANTQHMPTAASFDHHLASWHANWTYTAKNHVYYKPKNPRAKVSSTFRTFKLLSWRKTVCRDLQMTERTNRLQEHNDRLRENYSTVPETPI
jgi:hypothetical protein